MCTNRTQPRAYLSWVRNTCASISNITYEDFERGVNGTAQVFSSDWEDFDVYQERARKELFPWKWRVVQNVTQLPPDATSSECPSRTSKLGSFAIINLVTLFATVLLGRRPVVAFLTCGRFGTLGSPWWPVTALLATGLQIGMTFLNAHLVQTTVGYKATPTAQLALLWFCRPRLSWLAICLVKVGLEEGIYVSMGASAMLSEFVFQALALIYMGRTVDYARASGYYRLRAIEEVVIPWGKPAHIMYAGALLWLTAIWFVVLNVIMTFFGLWGLVRRLLACLSIRVEDLSESARKRADIKGGYKAITRSMKASIRRGITQHFSRRLPPMEQMARMMEVHQRHVQSPETDQQWAITLQIDERGQPMGPRKLGDEMPRIMATETETGNSRWWLQNMGLTRESLDRFVTVFVWMVLPFIGQWLFWIGFVDLVGDLCVRLFPSGP